MPLGMLLTSVSAGCQAPDLRGSKEAGGSTGMAESSTGHDEAAAETDTDTNTDADTETGSEFDGVWMSRGDRYAVDVVDGQLEPFRGNGAQLHLRCAERKDVQGHHRRPPFRLRSGGRRATELRQWSHPGRRRRRLPTRCTPDRRRVGADVCRAVRVVRAPRGRLQLASDQARSTRSSLPAFGSPKPRAAAQGSREHPPASIRHLSLGDEAASGRGARATRRPPS